MPAQMPLALQKLKLKDDLKKRGVAPDLVDVDALVDPSLSYPENSAIVLKEAFGSTQRANALLTLKPDQREAAARSLVERKKHGKKKSTAGTCPLGPVEVRAYVRACPGGEPIKKKCAGCGRDPAKCPWYCLGTIDAEAAGRAA